MTPQARIRRRASLLAGIIINLLLTWHCVTLDCWPAPLALNRLSGGTAKPSPG
ncbi:hypothetical protein [Arthrobacter sp. ZGTC412]|uniref:hypothetical protein n=1 Tax=Arthrobacter sp. ZGTC412 TaxID=2058900 RepID=UPI0015E484F2|nr:hypothetical protein [Arthrobacter sp. ZGTC412]